MKQNDLVGTGPIPFEQGRICRAVVDYPDVAVASGLQPSDEPQQLVISIEIVYDNRDLVIILHTVVSLCNDSLYLRNKPSSEITKHYKSMSLSYQTILSISPQSSPANMTPPSSRQRA